MKLRAAIFVGFLSGVFGSISEVVEVDGLGTVIGLPEYTSWTNRKIYSFRNIPFAQAPVDDLRFRPPVKVTTWNGTLYATAAGNRCPQTETLSLTDASGHFDEDCLSLNVFVPEVEVTVTALPVMIFIHGGTFIANHAENYQPGYLLEEDVILVVPQFRLGIFGLLSLQTDEVPGNVMFLDQIMAMQWVQDNIGYFGGDKDRVTLFGQSSGAATVNLHLLSPLSQGLFSQAIIQSGSALATWVVDYTPVSSAIEFATLLGCNTTSIPTITSCMKSLTVQQILLTYNQYYMIKFLSGGLVSIGGSRAVIQEAGDYRFLTEDPVKVIESGNFLRVPLMGGVTKHDGSFLLKSTYDLLLEPFSLWNNSNYLERNFTSFVVESTGITDTTGGITHTLMNTYFPNGELGNFEKMLPGTTDESYLYTFDYKGSNSALNLTGSNYPSDGGVGHGDDLVYLFPHFNTLTESDMVVAKRMVQLWTSFAQNGVPTADDVESWHPMSTRSGPYLTIAGTVTEGDDFLYEYDAAVRDAASNSPTLPIAFKLIVTVFFILKFAINNF